MKPFWTHETLPVPAHALLRAVFCAHAASSQRDNVSAQTVQLAALGSGDYTKAIAAGLLTLGGIHAPLADTMRLLQNTDPTPRTREILAKGRRVPGWGSSFHKGEPDPLWTEVDEALVEHFPGMAGRISAVTQCLHDNGKVLYPNPSAYTAAAALIVRLPRNIAPYLFLAGRLDGWSQLIQRTLAH